MLGDRVSHIMSFSCWQQCVEFPSVFETFLLLHFSIGRTGRAGNRGKATSFVNEGNRGMLRELLSLLEESAQTVPDWFYQMVRQCTSAYRGGFGGGSGGGGGSSFGRRGYGSGHGSNDFGGSKFNSSYSSMSRNNSAGTHSQTYNTSNCLQCLCNELLLLQCVESVSPVYICSSFSLFFRWIPMH